MQYIPQAPPFVMVGELLATDEKYTITNTLINPNCLFVVGNRFTESGMIENIAQTIAAGSGWKAAKSNQKPPIGYIGAIKNWELFHLPQVGDKITTKVEVMHEIMNAQVVKATISCKNQLMAQVEMKIFLQ